MQARADIKPFDPCARDAGFTLVELLVTMSIVGILTSIAIPAFRYVTNTSRISGEANTFLGSIWSARGMAVEAGSPVTVCPSTNHTSCNVGPSGWQNGWIVFSDYNKNGTVEPGEPVRSIQPAFGGTDTLAPNPVLSAITFNREGFAVGLVSGNTFELHDATGNARWTRCISINLAGSAITQSAGTGNCT
jgi:type IV fimbrial biogenesis protein FimT